LIWLFLERSHLITPDQPQTLLHFAPEPGLVRRFAQMPHLRYVTADLFDPSVMMRFDITTIPFDDHAFDLILCSHVLEHVPNDRQAMHELYRVLKPGGIALILVPIQGERTFEDATITDPLLRERYFGQFDHVRMYGTDIIQRLQQAGFYVQEIGVRDIITTQDEIERMGLPVNETIFVCRKAEREVRLAS
jgi:SAM-dependent methyltransferase